MYCFQCGKQIRDDATFCQYCGAKQNNTVNSVTVEEPITVRTSCDNGEFDRDALKIYLQNVLSLECINANYERKIKNFNEKIRQNGINNDRLKEYLVLKHKNRNSDYIKGYLIRKHSKNKWEEYYAHFCYDGANIYVAYYNGHGIHYASLSNNNWENEWYWLKITDASISQFRKTAYWNHYEDYGSGFFERLAQREEARNAFLKAYEDFKAEAPDIYQRNVETSRNNEINWKQQKTGVIKELSEIKRLLKQAYDINIIPSQFRHKIHAIYYLHDFVSTSRESFTTALLHFDLDEIKAKLDKIIAQQESIIIQNAVMIAQNEELAKQNQQHLEQLSKIESNTSQAAQYAQIAANNAETCAWISVANYIEDHINK